MMDFGQFYAGMRSPWTNIMTTCKQIRNEGQEFFYNNNHFELLVAPQRPNLVNGDLGAPILLPIAIKPELLTSLRVLLQLEQAVHILEAIDWSIFKSMPNLRILDVAMAMIEACPAHSPNARQWDRSLFLRALVMDIIMAVPESTTLRWGSWDGLGSHHTELQLHNVIYYLEGDLMSSIADEYAQLRGQSFAKSPRRTPKLDKERLIEVDI
jgi:hypothetical protein